MLRAALMDTLHQGFGALWNEQLEEVWTKAVDVVEAEMIIGLKEGYAKLQGA